MTSKAEKRSARAGRTDSDLKSSPLQKRAYAEVKRLIVTGEAAPGSFLSERQLGQRLGMSKTPVHVALERLAAEGFVSVSPQQGVVVRDMSIQDIVEHYEVRQAIEAFVVSKLAGKLSPEQIARLRASLAEQKKSLRTKDMGHSVELDAAFHLLLCEFVANSQLSRLMEQFRERIHQVILRAAQIDPTRMQDSLDEHTRIVESIIAGDADQASQEMVAHLESGKQRHLNPRRL
jgi:DNA-binding GntR family transcriptional regulator